MVKAFTPWGVEVNFYTLWCNGQHCKEYPILLIPSQLRNQGFVSNEQTVVMFLLNNFNNRNIART